MKNIIILLSCFFLQSCTITKTLEAPTKTPDSKVIDPAFKEGVIFNFQDYFIRYKQEGDESKILRVKNIELQVATEKPQSQHETICSLVSQYFYKRVIVFQAEKIDFKEAAIKTARLLQVVAAHKKQNIIILSLTAQDERGRIYTFTEFPKTKKMAYLSEVY